MAAGGRKRRPKAGPKDGGQLAARRAEAGQLPVLAEERRPEEAGVVGRERDRDAGAQERKDGVPAKRKRPRRVVRGEADVERDAGTREVTNESRVARGGDAVGDPPGLQPPERLGDRVGPPHLAGVDDGRETEAGQAPVDRREVARREGELVPAEAEADGARPGVPHVEVEDAVRRFGAEVPDGVEKDPDPAVSGPLVSREDRLDGVADVRPAEAEPLDDGGRDVDLGTGDPLRAKPGGQVSGEEGEVGRTAQQPADVAVEGEEAGEAVEPAPRADRRGVGEEGGAGPSREANEGGRPDGPLEVDVELGLRPLAERVEEGGVGHAKASYGTPRRDVFSRVPSERLWLRAAAFGLDLICLAGGPLLVATVVVFLVVLFAPEPPAGLPGVFRAAQLLFVVLFLLRDARGASPGKHLLGLSVVRAGGGRAGPIESILRNLPLLVPGLNLLEAAAVARRPDSRRLGDRLAGTTVGES